MSKKDFELIAHALHTARNESRDRYANWRYTADHTAHTMADALATTNPKFDRARFLAACGVQS